MNRRDEDTRVWPRAGADLPAGDEEAPEGPPSLWERLWTPVWHFFTIEVPDEPDPQRPRPSLPRVPATHGRLPSPDRAPRTAPPPAEAMAETSVRQRGAWRGRALRTRSRRHGRPTATPLARRHRWAAATVVLAGVAAAALLVAHPGRPRPPATAGGAARPGSAAPAHPGPAAASPASPGQAAPALDAAARSTPDCASMGMRPVSPPGSSTSPSVAGLCFSLGGGSGWRIGCAPGFQAACDPSLQTAIACVRQAGARHGGVVTAAEVRACDVAAADASRSAGAT